MVTGSQAGKTHNSQQQWEVNVRIRREGFVGVWTRWRASEFLKLWNYNDFKIIIASGSIRALWNKFYFSQIPFDIKIKKNKFCFFHLNFSGFHIFPEFFVPDLFLIINIFCNILYILQDLPQHLFKCNDLLLIDSFKVWQIAWHSPLNIKFHFYDWFCDSACIFHILEIIGP